ncbi:MAG: TraR/DksA C4-type zinc finger protein [Nitrospinota bacterium]
MTKDEKDAIKKKLLSVRQELLNGVDKVVRHSNDEFHTDVPDLNDEATRTYHRQVMLSLGEVDRQQLKLVDEALGNLGNDEFGVCIDCEEIIPVKRLMSVPYVKRCIGCKEKWEESQKK